MIDGCGLQDYTGYKLKCARYNIIRISMPMFVSRRTSGDPGPWIQELEYKFGLFQKMKEEVCTINT